MSSLPPVSGSAKGNATGGDCNGRTCLGFIASRSNFRHHRRQPGAKMPPKREFWSRKFDTKLHNLITWVNMPDNPLDLRSTAPVSRHKSLYKGNIKLTENQKHWIPQEEIPIGEKSRSNEEKTIYPYHRKTRCEEWSTLRAILPSIGHTDIRRPGDWCQGSEPRRLTDNRQESFPRHCSEMTRYTDAMGLTNRLFNLH